MTVQCAKTQHVSAATRLDAFMGAYTPTVANIARGALARLRKQVPGAIELVGDRYTRLVRVLADRTSGRRDTVDRPLPMLGESLLPPKGQPS